MPFWNLRELPLNPFRPGIQSTAHLGEGLVLAVMEIAPGQEDPGHDHPFDQCGMVLEGRVEMFVGEDRQVLGPHQAYFLPAGVRHGWKTLDNPVRILDVSAKPRG